MSDRPQHDHGHEVGRSDPAQANADALTHVDVAHDHRRPHHHPDRHGIRGFIAGIFSSHSHDPGDSMNSALSTSAVGMQALKVSLAGLAITAGIQVVIVAISGSVALLADTIHNLSDALTAVPLGIAFVLGRRRATKRYTYGYGRAEDLAGIFVVAMIALSAAVAGWEALERLREPHVISNVGWVLLAGMVGFVGNELVAVYRIRVGRQIGSAALVADGLHARTDGFTSLAVVAGALGVLAGWPQADPIVGLLITVAILFVLKGAARDVYRRLMDGVDPELVDDVHLVLASVPGVHAIESVRIRWIGHELRAEAGIISDADLSLADAHDIAEGAHHRLLHDIPRLSQVAIHSSPCGHDGRDHHSTTAHHYPEHVPVTVQVRPETP